MEMVGLDERFDGNLTGDIIFFKFQLSMDWKNFFGS